MKGKKVFFHYCTPFLEIRHKSNLITHYLLVFGESTSVRSSIWENWSIWSYGNEVVKSSGGAITSLSSVHSASSSPWQPDAACKMFLSDTCPFWVHWYPCNFTHGFVVTCPLASYFLCQSGLPCSHCVQRRILFTCSLRYIFNATPADLLIVRTIPIHLPKLSPCKK